MKARMPHPCILKFRQYNVYNIITCISQYSKRLFYLNNSDINAVILQTSSYGQVYISAWELVDMIYFAIQHSSLEPSAKVINNEREFVDLYHFFDSYKNDIDIEIINNYRDNVLLFVHCFGGEQTRFQMVKPQMDSFFRTMYLLDVVMRRMIPKINIDQIIYEKLHLSLIEFSTAIFSLWAGSKDKIIVPVDITNSKSLLRSKNILPILEYYSCTLEEIKMSDLKRQIFYSKPLIKTPDNNFIISNYHLFFFCFQECVYWLIRDYYNQNGSRAFTSEYGKCFEDYFHELLNEYLSNEQFERIQEGRTQKADWKLTIGDYKLLVEQKSSLAYIGVKQQTPDLEKAASFLRKTWGKAIKQLDNTEKEISDGEYIKIILVVDDYFMDEALDIVFQVDDDLPENDGRYWLVSIDMMEMLLYTYKNVPDKFLLIMEEKMSLELEHSSDGRSFSMLFSKYDINKNEHINQHKFLKYKEEIFKIVKEDLRKDL